MRVNVMVGGPQEQIPAEAADTGIRVANAARMVIKVFIVCNYWLLSYHRRASSDLLTFLNSPSKFGVKIELPIFSSISSRGQ